MKKYLFTRKHGKREYTFFLKKFYNTLTDEFEYYISVETEENCFGYRDNIILVNGKAVPEYRYQPEWILKRLTKQMIKAERKYLPC